jgi:hypothetical protein
MIAVLVLLLAALALPAGAQIQAAPEEPQIVLPEVILRIEDFSVENLAGAAAPGGDESLPPARELPLPSAEESLLAESAVPPAPPESEGGPVPATKTQEKKALSAQLELGAGTLSQLYSQVSLFGLGEQPRFRLRFLHDTLDGMGGHPFGSGFNLRQEDLEGGLKFNLGKLGLNFDGGLREEERGLQDQSPFISRIVRSGTLSSELAWPFARHWNLVGSLDGAFASQLFTGTSPEALDELEGSPKLSVEFRTERFWMGVDGSYSYLAYDGEPSQRGSALARFGVDVAKALRVEGSGGWQWGSLYGHLFPFNLTLTVTPASYLSILASGGYKVEELDARTLLATYPWANLPAQIVDDHGWFADLTTTFTFKRAFTLEAGAHLSWPEAAPEPLTAQDPTTGLYPLQQVAAARAAVEASLRWTPASETYVSAGWRMELAEHPAFTPGTELRLEAGVAGKRWGGHGSFLFQLGYAPAPPDFTLTPVLSLGGFFQASEAIRLDLELEDLLSPLTGARLDWAPFVAPGIRGILKVQINL